MKNTRHILCLVGMLATFPVLTAFDVTTGNGHELWLPSGPHTLSLYLLPTATWNPSAEDAAEAWNNVYGAYDKLDYQEVNGGRCDHSDGYNAVEWDDWSDPACNASASNSALAVTITTYDTGDGEILETDVLFNANYPWTTSLTTAESGAAYYFTGVVTHEFGHVLGLGHENNHGTVMNSIYSLVQAELQADDMAGHRYLYDSGNSQTNVAMSPWMIPTSSSYPSMEASCDTWAEAGGTMYLEGVAQNRGTDEQNGVEVDVLLSTNDTISCTDTVIGYGTVDLYAGDHDTLSGDVTIPADTAEGYWYVGMYIDPGNVISESTGDDNEMVCPDPVWVECPDADGDGYDTDVCGGSDCDDSSSQRHPGHTEVTCNGIDDDCNSSTEDEPDADGDGYTVCDDCDDGDASVHPGATEIVCNGLDDDCNSSTEDEPDADGDGYSVCDDCDDGDPSVNPGVYLDDCNNVDDDCDGSMDEDCEEPSDDDDDDDASDDDDDAETGDDDDTEAGDDDDTDAGTSGSSDTASGQNGAACHIGGAVAAPNAMAVIGLLSLMAGIMRRRSR